MHILLLSLLLSTVQPSQARTISDSLVKNLECETLTRDNVFKSLQPDAFETTRQLPVRNWGANGLGQCWGLALSQRAMFYLLRFNEAAASVTRSDVTNWLNIVGENKSARMSITPIPDRDMAGYFDSHSFIAQLINGDGKMKFAAEVEQTEKDHFYRAGNIGKIFVSRERPVSANRESMRIIAQNASLGRMTLVIVRPSVTAQHVVLIKSVQQLSPTQYVMRVYDSNQPEESPELEYKDGHFTSYGILHLIDNRPGDPMGVTIEDEKQMDKLQTTTYEYYKKLCQ